MASFKHIWLARLTAVQSSVLACSLAVALGVSVEVPASEHAPAELDERDYRVSYIYAAIMGTGTYKIDGRRITMLQLPFGFTQQDMEDGKPGITWYAPVSIGYDAVTDNNWLERVFDEDLVTVSAMPGFRLELPLNDTWSLRPLGHLGYTHDFTRDEHVVMGVLGARALATLRNTDGSELRWGLGVRIAGEHQFESHASEGFAIIETGVDFRRDTGLEVLENKVNMGVHLVLQRYSPMWEVSESPREDSEVRSLVEVGFSVGLKRPRKIFGIRVERVRVGYQRGDGFTGWSLGSRFPF